MTRRPLLLALPALLAGCDGAGRPPPPPGAGEACEALALEQAQSWEHPELLGMEEDPVEDGDAGVALGDLDGDGWLDALFVSPRASWALWNDGAGSLELADVGLPPALGASLADVDGDGDLDAWLGTMPGEPDELWINDGSGAFEAVEMPGGVRGSYTGSFADVDGDGDLDLFVARYHDGPIDPDALLDGTLQGEGSELYRNDGGAFTVVEGGIPAEVADDVAFLGQWIDADADGDQDLYLANDFGPFLGRNRLLRNNGSGGLAIDDGCGCDLEMFAMGSGVGDADGDGVADLFLTDIGGPNLLRGAGDGTFYDATLTMNADIPASPEHLAGWGTAFVDLDGDAWQDLPMVFGPVFSHGDDWLESLGPGYEGWIDSAAQADVLLRSTGEGTFEDISERVGFTDTSRGRSLAVGDLDRDGRPDLVTAGMWFLRTWIAGGGCGPGATLQPAGAGLAASYGAKVEASVGGRTITRWLHPESTWSSSAPEIHLGLAGSAAAEDVRVTWPDGRVSELGSVEAGEFVEIEP